MVGKVFDRMESVRPVATKTELRIIDGIRRMDRNSLIYMSITELSGVLDVAEATVLRFCRKLDYRGFQDFKLNLSQELGETEKETSSTARRVADEMTDAILETYKQINYEECLEIARKIVASRRVCAFAVGASSVATLEMRFRLLRAGIILDAATDSHIQSIAAANFDERDFLVLVSISGSTKDILHVAEIARSVGATILVITNYNKSPLARYADYLLLSSKKEAANDGGSLSATVAQAYVVDVLCNAVYEVLGIEGTERRMKASDAVAEKAI